MSLRQVCDHLHQLVATKAVLECKGDQVARPGDDGAAFGRTCHGDAVTPSELQQTLVSELAQGTEHRVGIDTEHRCEVTGRRKPLSGVRLAVCDRAPDLGCNLFVQRSRLVPVDPNVQHDTSYSSISDSGLSLSGSLRPMPMGPVRESGVEVVDMATKHDDAVQVSDDGLAPTSIPLSTSGDSVAGAPPADRPPTEVTNEQALIEEARRRQRRRRRWISAVVAVALVGTGLGLGISFDTRSPATAKARSRSLPSSAPSPASSPVGLNRPQALAIAPDGDLLIANQGTNQIIARTPKGTLTVEAGNGTAGYGGNGGSAIDAELDDPAGMAVGTNGTIYVADTANNRVRAISPSGTITTVAGNGRLSFRELGGPATDVSVPQPVALALGSKGELYVADDAGIQIVSPNGVLSTLVHAGAGALTIDGTPTAFSPDAIALGTNGYLYVADFSPKLLVELTPKGNVIDSWPIYVTTAGLATTGDGSIVVGNYANFTVDRITNGQLTVVTAFTRNSLAGLAGAFRPSGVAVTSTGKVYVDTDGVNGGTNTPAIATIGATGQPHLLIAREGTGP